MVMGTNKSNRKPSIAERQRARQEHKTLLLETKIERRSQAAIMQQLLERHQGDIPVQVLTEERANRLMAITCSGAELARS